MKPLIAVFILLFAYTAFAQAPAIQWEKNSGGEGDERATSVHQTPDRGYIIAGWSKSNDGDVTGHHGSLYYWDGWIVKTDSSGDLQWEKSYGGSYSEFPQAIRVTKDGGYIFIAQSYSNDGDVTGHHGSTQTTDYWVVKVDSFGTIQWQRSYGGTDHDAPVDIRQTFDGGYILAGTTLSFDGDVANHHGKHGNSDYWIIKINSTGNIEWEHTYGGSFDEEPCGILQTSDSGYFVAGYSTSNDGDVTGHHGKLNDVPNIWVIKLDNNGKLMGERSLPGSEGLPTSVCFSKEEGYLVAGISGSFPKHEIYEHGESDMFIAKLTKRGRIDTVCVMGGSKEENAYSLSQSSDGGYIIAGQTFSEDGDVTGFHGFNDYWIVKLDSNCT